MLLVAGLSHADDALVAQVRDGERPGSAALYLVAANGAGSRRLTPEGFDLDVDGGFAVNRAGDVVFVGPGGALYWTDGTLVVPFVALPAGASRRSIRHPAINDAGDVAYAVYDHDLRHDVQINLFDGFRTLPVAVVGDRLFEYRIHRVEKPFLTSAGVIGLCVGLQDRHGKLIKPAAVILNSTDATSIFLELDGTNSPHAACN
ncbi:MAG: hypothetical protein ACNA7W_09575 [Pseudomonadales bacterium]